jgi:hypothetical protein
MRHFLSLDSSHLLPPPFALQQYERPICLAISVTPSTERESKRQQIFLSASPLNWRAMPRPEPQRPPLWQVMDAVTKVAWNDGGNTTTASAAQLRALANEAEVQFAFFVDPSERIVVKTFVAWLLSEADRAEAGE